MDTACAILAGGKSSRMGRDKATVEYQGISLIRNVYQKVSTVFDDVIVISSRHATIENVKLPIFRDIVAMQSPAVGIATALIYSRKPHIFVVACDMPFLTPEAMQCILDASRGMDITIPMVGAYYEPLHAIYSRHCLAPLLRLIDGNNLKISNVFPYVTMTVVKDAPCFKRHDGRAVFSNINTQEELTQINAGT
ncbi:MAG: molybdenum cofactor guanylyltransferase [Syntrophorhabdus sp.]